MAYPYKPNMNSIFVTMTMADVSAPTTLFFAPGFAGRIRGVTCVIANATTVADSLCKLQVNTTDVTGGGWTVAFTGSAAGSIFSARPTALNQFTQSDHIRIISDGAGSTTAVATITLELEPN